MNDSQTNTPKSFSRMTKAELIETLKDIQEKFDTLHNERDKWQSKALKLDEKIEESSNRYKFSLEKEEKEKMKLQTKVHSLEKDIQKLKEKAKKIEKIKDEDLPELPLTKSTFKVEIYHQQQGQIQGKIEHLLTKKKQTFQDLRGEVLVTFIKQHLPGKISESLSEKAMPKVRISEIAAFQHKSRQPVQTIHHNENFELRIKIVSESDRIQLKDEYQYLAEIYAKPLSGLQETRLVKKIKQKAEKGILSIKMYGQVFDPGPYRLDTRLFLSNQGSQISVTEEVRQSSFLNVY